jgi:hypothetical protein
MVSYASGEKLSHASYEKNLKNGSLVMIIRPNCCSTFAERSNFDSIF